MDGNFQVISSATLRNASMCDSSLLHDWH